MRRTRVAVRIAAGMLFWGTGCGEPAAPVDRASVTVYAGELQYGTPGADLQEPLQVIVLDGSRRPRSGVSVRWRLTRGTGATLATPTTTTGSNGIAATSLRVGPDTGRYEVQAVIDNMIGEGARFEIRAVRQPTLASITPGVVSVRDTITIAGDHFSLTPEENTVLFDGIRGQVLTAAKTQLRVVVPACLPTRSVQVRAGVGSVLSESRTLSVAGNDAATVRLQPGESMRLTAAADLRCQRFTADPGAAYLLVAQNVSELSGTVAPFEITGLVTGGPTTTLAARAGEPGTRDYAVEWEARLRAKEREIRRDAGLDGLARVQPRALAAPEIGDRRKFKVLNKDSRFSDVEAEVRHISQRAIFYIDRNAPPNGLTATDLERIGSMFDSPIWNVTVDAFGNPSDIDANGKVIILLTAVVNELTPRNSSSFVGGFFYGCDLVTRDSCSGSNRGEIFYMLVPDPDARFGNVRTRSMVVNAVMPILAHEFQHMIHFAVRSSLDALWLSEGLAHMAEDLVADEMSRAGDAQSAELFRAPNYNRAAVFLRDTTTSLISEELPGTIEQRGAAWLLLKYLQGHHGSGILRTITSSMRVSIDNVTRAAGSSWSELMSDWAVALWADNAPQLPAGTVAAKHTFPNIDLRRTIGNGFSYPLYVTSLPYSDFALRGALHPSAQRFVYLVGPATAGPPLTVSVTGSHGGAFAPTGNVQVTILRVR